MYKMKWVGKALLTLKTIHLGNSLAFKGREING